MITTEHVIEQISHIKQCVWGANQIVKAQESLHQLYTDEDYYRVIDSFLEKSDGDIMILGVIANDKTKSATVRLFAIAAMGE